MNKALMLIILLCFATSSGAATIRYVSDKLEVPLRGGESLKHKVVRMLASGEELEILAANNDTGYSHVKTKNGTEGFILTRFLMTTPSAKDRIVAAEQKIASLEIDNNRLNGELRNVNERHTGSDSKLEVTYQEKIRLQQEIAEIRHKAANTLALDNENKQLKAQIISMQRDIQAVEQEKARLNDRASREWFLYGAGVILVGVFIGIMLARMFGGRSRRWNSL